MSSTSASSAVDVVPLHVFYSDFDIGSKDASVTEEGLGTNKPVVRKQQIFDSLQKSSVQQGHMTFHLITEQASTTLAELFEPHTHVHSKGFIEFLMTAFTRWEELKETRDYYMSAEGTRHDGNYELFVPGQIAPRHSTSKPGTSVHSQMCYYAMDRLTPITRHLAPILRWDVSVVRAAVQSLLKGECTQAYAMTTQPGHHSHFDQFGGYCFVNESAYSAALLLERYQRVGVLDVDYHAGNGTMQIFYENPRVFVTSLHASPDIDYPYNQGWEDQIGEGEGKGSTLNIPLPKGTDWKVYQPKLIEALAKMRDYGIEALVVSLGVDTVDGDPESSPLGGFKIHNEDYDKLGHLIRTSFGKQIPTIWIQEGGYKLDDGEAGEVVRHVLRGPLPEEKSKE